MNGPIEIHQRREYGRDYYRSAYAYPQVGELTLRVTADDQFGFRAIEIHLTPAEAASLAQQLLQGEQQ